MKFQQLRIPIPLVQKSVHVQPYANCKTQLVLTRAICSNLSIRNFTSHCLCNYFRRSHSSSLLPSTWNLSFSARRRPKSQLHLQGLGNMAATSTSRNLGTDTVTSGQVMIAIAQMNSQEDKKVNMEICKTFIIEAADIGAKMIFFPECFDYIAGDRTSTIKLAEPLENGMIMDFYRGLAKEKKIWLSLGGFHERQVSDSELSDSDSLQHEQRTNELPWLKNSHVIINADGEIVHTYHKVHLFDYAPRSSAPLMESSFTKPGLEIGPIVKSPVGKLGLGICYDLRFPEFSSTLRTLGAQVLLYPAAFTYMTGLAHWHVLLRARAIENQCYVIAAAQCGKHSSDRTSYGHSMIVTPWGEVTELGEEPGLMLTMMDLDKLNEVRKQMPVEYHRRPELYFKGQKAGNDDEEKYSVPSAFEDDETVPFGPLRIKKKTVFLESPFSRAFVNRKCVLPGHVLIVTKRPVERLHDLNEFEIKDLFLMAQFVQSVMEKKHKARSSTITVQDGVDAGQTIKHVHIHIIPRQPMDYAENDKIYLDLETHDKGPNVRWREEEDMVKECLEIRNVLHENYAKKLMPLGYPYV